eukprot:GHVP01041297.1.p1 GENE.GHVP01041297.1~~GHVP01041297.1.p1  ORF type:complete len:330 (+),score=45.75 GHVP01041297.1:37-990(+)
MTKNFFNGQIKIISLAVSVGLSCSGHNPPEATSKNPPCSWPSCDTVIARCGAKGSSVVKESFSQMVYLVNKGKGASDPVVAKLILSVKNVDTHFWRRALTEAYIREPDRHSILQSIFEYGMEASAREAIDKFLLHDDLLKCVNEKGENLLHLAVRSGNISMVHILASSLKHRFVDLINHRRADGMIPQELAGMMNKDDMNSVIAYHRNSYSLTTKSENFDRGLHCHHHCHCCQHATSLKPASLELTSNKPELKLGQSHGTFATKNLHVLIPVEKKVVGKVFRQVGEVFEVHPKPGYCERLYNSPQQIAYVDHQAYAV